MQAEEGPFMSAHPVFHPYPSIQITQRSLMRYDSARYIGQNLCLRPSLSFVGVNFKRKWHPIIEVRVSLCLL